MGDGSTGVIRGGQLTLGDTTTVSLDWLSRTLAGGAWSIGDGGFAFTGTGKADTLQALGLRQHAAALNKILPQTLGAEGVQEKLRWDDVLWDHDTMASVADERLTAKTGGIYRVDFRCVTDPQRFNFELYKNGALLCPLFRGTTEATNASVLVELTAGDYLEVWAASFGGAFQILGSSGEALNSTFSLSLVREN